MGCFFTHDTTRHDTTRHDTTVEYLPCLFTRAGCAIRHFLTKETVSFLPRLLKFVSRGAIRGGTPIHGYLRGVGQRLIPQNHHALHGGCLEQGRAVLPILPPNHHTHHANPPLLHQMDHCNLLDMPTGEIICNLFGLNWADGRVLAACLPFWGGCPPHPATQPPYSPCQSTPPAPNGPLQFTRHAYR